MSPNQPKTPNRVFRVEDALWNAAKQVAEARGETLTDVLRLALTDYVARHQDAIAGAPRGD